MLYNRLLNILWKKCNSNIHWTPVRQNWNE